MTAARGRSAKTDRLAEAIAAGERRALARAITLIESTRGEHRDQAQALLARLLSKNDPGAGPGAGNAVRIGISGTPGVGKSTFIEAFGGFLTGRGHKVAVLAVDPSSGLSGGSILGDKTRMPDLARDPNAYIRPSPSGGTLGGVARRTREAMFLVEAAGFDVVLVETVGVGQSETAVADMVDIFLLLLAPGGGDELQGIKRGIIELADLVVVNKADGDLAPAAGRAASDYRAALGLIRPKSPHWTARVLLASALNGTGIDEIWAAVEAYRDALGPAGELDALRARQAMAWMWAEVNDRLAAELKRHPAVAAALPDLEARVAAGELTPSAAAAALLEKFLGRGQG